MQEIHGRFVAVGFERANPAAVAVKDSKESNNS